MKVTVILNDKDVQPLIQDHLEKGTSVAAEISAAVCLWNSVKKLMSEGKVLCAVDKDSTSIRNGYVKPLDVKTSEKFDG